MLVPSFGQQNLLFGKSKNTVNTLRVSDPCYVCRLHIKLVSNWRPIIKSKIATASSDH